MSNKQVEQMEGIIYQVISGFYYVWSGNKSYTTKPRGLFRHQKITPLVGDRVIFELNQEDPDSDGRIVKLLPRRNEIKRPSVVNIDHAFVVMSLVEPDFSYYLLDTFLVSLEAKKIKGTIILTKHDLLVKEVGEAAADAQVDEIRQVYEPAGYDRLVVSADEASIQAVNDYVHEGLYVIMGQSGVGKSTLLNRLIPDLEIRTAEISESLGRGRHTTREVTLYELNGGFLADTPGFSTVDLTTIAKEDLRLFFPEIRRKGQACRFRSCLHKQEPGCGVKQAVEGGIIPASRYENYLHILQQIEETPPRY